MKPEETRFDLVAGWIEMIGLTEEDQVENDTRFVLARAEELERDGVPEHVVEMAAAAWEFLVDGLAERRHAHLFRRIERMEPIDAMLELVWELRRNAPVREYISWNCNPESFMLDVFVSILRERKLLTVLLD